MLDPLPIEGMLRTGLETGTTAPASDPTPSAPSRWESAEGGLVRPGDEGVLSAIALQILRLIQSISRCTVKIAELSPVLAVVEIKSDRLRSQLLLHSGGPVDQPVMVIGFD